MCNHFVLLTRAVSRSPRGKYIHPAAYFLELVARSALSIAFPVLVLVAAFPLSERLRSPLLSCFPLSLFHFHRHTEMTLPLVVSGRGWEDGQNHQPPDEGALSTGVGAGPG